jgi:septum formation topological specificity factor MinE
MPNRNGAVAVQRTHSAQSVGWDALNLLAERLGMMILNRRASNEVEPSRNAVRARRNEAAAERKRPGRQPAMRNNVLAVLAKWPEAELGDVARKVYGKDSAENRRKVASILHQAQKLKLVRRVEEGWKVLAG